MQITNNQYDQHSIYKWLKLFGAVLFIINAITLFAPNSSGFEIEQLLGWLFFTCGVIQLGAAVLTLKSVPVS